MNETHDDPSVFKSTRQREPTPGAVVIWSESAPACVAFACQRGALELGRDELRAAGFNDAKVSRSHLRLERTERGWRCTDRGSRNGTWVDGARCEGSVEREAAPVVRIGQTLLLAVEDAHAYAPPGVVAAEGVVAGPALRAAFARLEGLAKASEHVLLQGPTGAGKEVAAGVFHRAGASSRGPLVAVNCATLPRDLAERLLFGARRGAFTGATDASGLVQQADGGTLFLDEVAELEPPVQAKLLRALETGAVLPLGATQPVSVRFRLCSATLRDLRDAVRAGRFREDLYYRLGRPAVHLPSLLERREEIPFHVADTLRALGERAPRCTTSFVEACLLRPWPGNVRELRMEVRAAAVEAAARGGELDADALDPEAGRVLWDAAREAPGPTAEAAPVEEEAPAPSKDVVWEALVRERGNVARTALALRLSRARLRRLIERWALDVDSLRGE